MENHRIVCLDGLNYRDCKCFTCIYCLKKLHIVDAAIGQRSITWRDTFSLCCFAISWRVTRGRLDFWALLQMAVWPGPLSQCMSDLSSTGPWKVWPMRQGCRGHVSRITFAKRSAFR